MRSFEDVRALFQKIAEQEQQFAVGSGGGAAGSRTAFRLSRPINGTSSVVATCLTDCPPGADRTALVRADDGEWYAFTQSPTTQGPESISQNRRSSPLDGRARVAALTYVQSSPENKKLYLSGHGSEAVFLCDVERLIPACPRVTGPIGTPDEYEYVDAYYMGGAGVSFINWNYEPYWYCPSFRNGLARGAIGDHCEAAPILIPPEIGGDPVTDFTPLPFPRRSYKYSEGFLVAYKAFFNRFPPDFDGTILYNGPNGYLFYIDENNLETHAECEYYSTDSYRYAIEQGANANSAFGYVGAFSFNDWEDPSGTVYYARKSVRVRIGEDPPAGLNVTATTRYGNGLGDYYSIFGAINGIFSASMQLIGHDHDNICLVPPTGGSDEPLPPPGMRDNNFFGYLSGDASSWYVSVYDNPTCGQAASSELRDLYDRSRYFRIQGSTVEESSEPYPEDWRSKDVMPNKALKLRNGNLWKGKFVEVDQSAIKKQGWNESSQADRPQNLWYTAQQVKLLTKNPNPVNGTLPVEDFHDASGNVVLDSIGNPVKVESKGVVQASARLTALSPADYANGQLPMFDIAIAGVF